MTELPENDRRLPVALRVAGKHCVIAGAGAVGRRKANSLCDANAQVTVVAPEARPDSLPQAVTYVESKWLPVHVEGAFLVVAATDDRALNKQIAAQAEEAGALCCNATDAATTQVAFGAKHRTDDGLTVAVFTGGTNPARARDVRDKIAKLLETGE